MKQLINILILILFFGTLTAQTGHWEDLNPTNNPGHRSSHGMASIGKNQVLLFGGYNLYLLNDTWLFNLEKNDWQKIDCKNPPQPRAGHVMCQISEKEVLLFGGSKNNSFGTFNDLWLFNLDSMDWRQLKPNGMNGTYFPPPTYRFGMAKLSETRVIIYGGEVDDTSHPNRLYSNETWIYHIDKNEWQQGLGLEARATSDNNLIELDSNIVLSVGGNNGILVNNYIFEDNGDNWRKIKDLKTNLDCITISCSASANLTKGIGMLFGGETWASSTEATWYDSTWIFNYYAKSWMKLDINPHPSDRLRGGMAKIDTNKVLLFGGDSKKNRRPEDTWLFVLDSIPSDVKEEEIIKNEISISPNPANNFIEISVPVGARHALPEEIRLYNVFGQEVNLTPTLSILGEGDNNPLTPFDKGELGSSSSQYSILTTQYSAKIDVSMLPAGVYFVRIGEKVSKFIKY